jgi:hypothetical protein
MPRRSQAWASPPCGEVAWWVPLRCPRCLSAPFFTLKFKKNFLEFFENFIFEDFLENDKRIKLGTKMERQKANQNQAYSSSKIF